MEARPATLQMQSHSLRFRGLLGETSASECRLNDWFRAGNVGSLCVRTFFSRVYEVAGVQFAARAICAAPSVVEGLAKHVSCFRLNRALALGWCAALLLLSFCGPTIRLSSTFPLLVLPFHCSGGPAAAPTLVDYVESRRGLGCSHSCERGQWTSGLIGDSWEVGGTGYSCIVGTDFGGGP